MTNHSLVIRCIRNEGKRLKKDQPKYHQIIEAAVEIIAENGYHSSQVSKIAKKANVADGTIYLYFKNKEDILISVFKEKMGEFIAEIESAISHQTTVSDKLLTLIQVHYEQFIQSPYLAIVAQLEIRQSKPELRYEINNVLKSYLNVIDAIINEGIEKGEIRADVNPKLIRQMIFGTIDETITTWVMKSQRYDLAAQAKEIHQLLTNGMFY